MKTKTIVSMLWLLLALPGAWGNVLTCESAVTAWVSHPPVVSLLSPQVSLTGVEPETAWDFDESQFEAMNGVEPGEMLESGDESGGDNEVLSRVVYLAYTRDRARVVKEDFTRLRITPELRAAAPEGGIHQRRSRFNDGEKLIAERLAWEGRDLWALRTRSSRIADARMTMGPRDSRVIDVEFKSPEGRDHVKNILTLIINSLRRGGQSAYLVVNAMPSNLSKAQLVELVQRVLGKLMEDWDRGRLAPLKELRILSGKVDHTFVIRPFPGFGGGAFESLPALVEP